MKGIKIVAGITIPVILGITIYFLTAPKWTGFYYLHAAGLDAQDEAFKRPSTQSTVNQFRSLGECQKWATQVRLRTKVISKTIARPTGEPEDVFICWTGCIQEGKKINCSKEKPVVANTEVDIESERRDVQS